MIDALLIAVGSASAWFVVMLTRRAPGPNEMDLDEIFDRDLPTSTPYEPPARNIFRGPADPAVPAIPRSRTDGRSR